MSSVLFARWTFGALIIAAGGSAHAQRFYQGVEIPSQDAGLLAQSIPYDINNKNQVRDIRTEMFEGK